VAEDVVAAFCDFKQYQQKRPISTFAEEASPKTNASPGPPDNVAYELLKMM
jgi:hypothetical protein